MADHERHEGKRRRSGSSGGGAENGRSRKKHRHRHHRSHKHDRSRHSRLDYDEEEEEEEKVTSRRSNPQVSCSTKAFLLESRGDKANVEFEKPDAKSVPRYASSLDPSSLCKPAPSEANAWKRYFENQQDHKARKVVSRPSRHHREKRSALEKGGEESLDFISFGESEGDEELPLSGEEGLPCTDEDYYTNKCNRELNQQVQATPGVVSVWLKLLAFQEEALSLRGTNVNSASAQTALTEKRIAILQSALKHCTDSEELALMLMKDLAKTVLPPSELNPKLEEIVKGFTNSREILFSYLKIRAGQFSDFDADGTRAVYAELVQMVACAKEETRRNGNDRMERQLDWLLVDLIASCCRMHLSTGNQHVAIAILQSVIEYNLLCPQSVSNMSRASKLKSFESFWKSESPMIGEEGALGWCCCPRPAMKSTPMEEPRYDESSLKLVPGEEDNLGDSDDGGLLGVFQYQKDGADCDTYEEDPPAQGEENAEDEADLLEVNHKFDEEYRKLTEGNETHSEIFSTWLSLESKRDATNWSYSRSDQADETESNSVQYEDIEGFVVELDLQSCDSNLTCLLSLLGLCEEMASYNRSKGLLLYDDFEYLDATFSQMKEDLKFSSNTDWLDALPRMERWVDTDVTRKRFAYNVLNLLMQNKVHNLSTEFWEELFELKFDVATSETTDAKDAKAAVEKLAKEYLAQMTGNMPLWAAYARFQERHGSLSTVCKIYMNLLSSLKASSLYHNSGDIPSMFLAFASLLERHSKLSQKYKVTPELVLRALGSEMSLSALSSGSVGDQNCKAARLGFQGIVQNAISEGSITSKASVSLILAASKFEAIAGNANGAYQICKEILGLLSSQGEAGATYHSFQFCMRSVALVISLRSIEREDVQVYLKMALGVFPSSPFLLTTCMREEYRVGATFRLEKTLTIMMEKKKAVTNLLALLVHQTEKKSYMVGHSFEKYIDTDASGDSCVLWSAYLRYLLKASQAKKAKRNYFRAIRSCPWSKAMYLDGLLLLNEHLSSKEKVEMVDLMQDKSILLHTDLYEVLLQNELMKETGPGDD